MPHTPLVPHIFFVALQICNKCALCKAFVASVGRHKWLRRNRTHRVFPAHAQQQALHCIVWVCAHARRFLVLECETWQFRDDKGCYFGGKMSKCEKVRIVCGMHCLHCVLYCLWYALSVVCIACDKYCLLLVLSFTCIVCVYYFPSGHRQGDPVAMSPFQGPFSAGGDAHAW